MIGRNQMKRLLNWGVFSLVLVAVWAVAGPAFLGGPASYVIVDGRSMEPTYHDGDLVVTRQKASYTVGDVVVYDAPIDSQFNVIHRIIEPTEGGFITQGDNRNEPDGWIAPHNTIYGSSWLLIPNGGRLILILRQPAVIAALVMGLATFEFLKHAEKKQRRRDETEAPAEVAA
jgi:signal peptidase I